MDYRYYPYSCERIERAIKREFGPDVGPDLRGAEQLESLLGLRDGPQTIRRRWNELMGEHLLAMLGKVQGMKGPGQTAKRGRWMGWVYAHAGLMHLFTQRQIQYMARRDSRSGQV